MNNNWKKYCPLMKGTCVNGFVKGMPESNTGERTVCAFMIILRGKSPQGDEEINDYGCSFHFTSILQVETNQIIRQAMASTDKVASEVAKHHATTIAAMSNEQKEILLSTDPRRKLLPGSNEKQGGE